MGICRAGVKILLEKTLDDEQEAWCWLVGEFVRLVESYLFIYRATLKWDGN